MTIPTHDAIIILGGGRTNDGSLTPLSTIRLDKGIELYHQNLAPSLLAMGGKYSTYREGAIEFPETGASLRKKYLMEHGDIASDAIIEVTDGRDTIMEAFAVRKKAKELGLKSFLLVTSEKHMKRSLFLFQRIFGDSFSVTGNEETSAITGDLLLDEEEKEYLELWKEALGRLAKEIPDPESWDTWYSENQEYYQRHSEIHSKFHPKGKESQAYGGVNEKEHS